MHEKIPVAVLGATGMVGQRFVTLLENHPWFQVECVAASPQSRGKKYADAVAGRWYMDQGIPDAIAGMEVLGVEDDLSKLTGRVQVVFSALDMDKVRIKAVEEAYAAGGVAVVSNNSAQRWIPDVPVIIPEVNAHHTDVIVYQRQHRNWDRGLVVVKPNCSIQPYVIPLDALRSFGLKRINVVTLQALSGAGKTPATWPEMNDNVIPFIKAEEDKSENEPHKIWGNLSDGYIVHTDWPTISATCIRVPVTDGHMAAVTAVFERQPTRDEILDAFTTFNASNPAVTLGLPFAPSQCIVYRHEDDRPQTRLDRMAGNGMSTSIGRFREEPNGKGWRFVGLSHNTIRGAAGGAIETAELLRARGYL